MLAQPKVTRIASPAGQPWTMESFVAKCGTERNDHIPSRGLL